MTRLLVTAMELELDAVGGFAAGAAVVFDVDGDGFEGVVSVTTGVAVMVMVMPSFLASSWMPFFRSTAFIFALNTLSLAGAVASHSIFTTTVSDRRRVVTFFPLT